MNKDELLQRLEKVKTQLNLPQKKKRIEQINSESTDPAFWQDNQRASQMMTELSQLVEQIEKVERVEMGIAQGADLGELEKDIKELETATFLAKPYDRESAIISVHAGQGGTEAMDWVAMLERMYLRYAQNRGWKTEVVDLVPGEEAGIKSVTIFINGAFAYGYLKNEAGAHRLVRLSPFNAQHLRQTSFALVEVLPQLSDNGKVELKEDDLQWQFFHASGHGGQNVQKVATAVRLTHKPTQIVVTAQTERFQEQNRKIARSLLVSKLWALESERAIVEQKELKGDYKPATWGMQIRSYVLHPYKQVKDLRTNIVSTNPQAVLDGGLDEFIEEEVRYTGKT